MTTKTTTLTIDGTEITEGSTITLYNGDKVVRRTLTVVIIKDHDAWQTVVAKTAKGHTFWLTVEDYGNELLNQRASSTIHTASYRGTRRRGRHAATHFVAA